MLTINPNILNAANFKKTFFEDQSGINNTYRKCSAYSSINLSYYSCKGVVDNFNIQYLNNFEGNQKGEYLTYQIGAETSWYNHNGTFITNNNVQIGGWLRKEDKRLFLGAYDIKNKKWIAYRNRNNELKSDINLNENEIKAYINKASYYYDKAIKIENEIKIIAANTNNDNLDNFKKYWWVVILIGIIIFFIYTQTIKSIPKYKKIKKIISKNEEAKIDNSQNIFLRFFRGNLSLPLSYWGFLFSFGVVVSVIFLILEKNKNEELIGLFSIICIGIYVYLYIGTWRSAQNYKKEKIKKKLSYGWGIAAQVAMVLGIVQFLNEFIKAFK